MQVGNAPSAAVHQTQNTLVAQTEYDQKKQAILSDNTLDSWDKDMRMEDLDAQHNAKADATNMATTQNKILLPSDGNWLEKSNLPKGHSKFPTLTYNNNPNSSSNNSSSNDSNNNNSASNNSTNNDTTNNDTINNTANKDNNPVPFWVNNKYTREQTDAILAEYFKENPEADLGGLLSRMEHAPTLQEFNDIGQTLYPPSTTYTPPQDILKMTNDDYLDALENKDYKTTTAYFNAFKKGLIPEMPLTDDQQRRFLDIMIKNGPSWGKDLLAGAAGTVDGLSLDSMDLMMRLGLSGNKPEDKQFITG
jgi:hypothetical protein